MSSYSYITPTISITLTENIAAITEPVFTSAPSVSGAAEVGGILICSPGAATEGPTFTYQWYQDGTTAIAGATAASYTCVTADVGHTLVCVVVATNVAGTAQAQTAPTGQVGTLAVNTGLPTISGIAVVGNTLSAGPGLWAGMPTLTYQWNDNGAAILGATNPTYTVQTSDLGNTLTVTVTATIAGVTGSTQATSLPTAVVTTGVAGEAVCTSPPVIDGTAQVGVMLAADPGEWTNDPTFTYQWYQDGTMAIAGAAASTYTCVTGDLGHTLTVTVTASVAGLPSAQASSAPTAAVVAAVPSSPQVVQAPSSAGMVTTYSNATAHSNTLGSVTSGNTLLLAVLVGPGATVTGVTGLGAAWTPLASVSDSAGTCGQLQFYKGTGAAGSGYATVNANEATFWSVGLFEVSNFGALDFSSYNTTTTAAVAPSTTETMVFTPHAPNDLIFAIVRGVSNVTAGPASYVTDGGYCSVGWVSDTTSAPESFTWTQAASQPYLILGVGIQGAAVISTLLPAAPTGPTAPTSGYRLLLADDFVGMFLDPNIWTATREYPGAASVSSGYNTFEVEAFDSANVSVASSLCTLTAKAQTVTVPSPPTGFPSTCNYTSGLICTANAANAFLFSPLNAGTLYFEAKIRIPGSATASATSTFPAFWADSARTYGNSSNNAAWTREMDFFEFHAPTALDSVNLYPAGGYGTGGSLVNTGAYESGTVADMSQAFHLYTVQVNSDGSFQLWIDGVSQWTVPAHEAKDWMCLILDYALAAVPDSGWVGDVMEIDYVMAWQDAGVTAGSGVLGGGVASGTMVAPSGATVPGAPTSVVATPGDTVASVAFSAPASTGGATITSYTVTASTGQTATGSTSPIMVTGLTDGTAVTFTVKAHNTVGAGPASAASAPVTPSSSPTVLVLGATSIVGAGQTSAAGYYFGSPYTATEGSGTSVDFRFYGSGGSASQVFTPAIYATSGGVPTTLLGTGAPVTVTAGAAAQWWTSALSGVSITNGATYVLALLSGATGSEAELYAVDGTGTNFYVFGSSFPSTWGSTSSEATQWTFAVDYDSSGAILVL